MSKLRDHIAAVRQLPMPLWLVLPVVLVFSTISLEYFFLPWFFVAICWFLFLILLTLKTKASISKAVWFNLAVIVFFFGILEAGAYWVLTEGKGYFVSNSVRYEGGYTQGYFVSNDVLGYGPQKDQSVLSRKFHEDKPVYEVTYTIENDGLRITPPGEPSRNGECIILFGGSFTFGEGVDDGDSMPYVLGTLQDRKVHNFGFHGYGPHQMLAAIENGMMDCRPRFAIYQAITGHVTRSAGYAPWDVHGPRYVMENGRLIYDGRVDDSKVASRLLKSYFYKIFLIRHNTSDQDIRLFLAVVDASHEKLAEKFPGIEFHVLLWDDSPNDNTYLKIKDGFESKSMEYHRVSDILPGFSDPDIRPGYKINHDGHPNPTAHRLIAEYIAKNIIEK